MRQEAEHGAPEGRLAAAGFADQAERLARPQVEGHAVDGPQRRRRLAGEKAAADREVHLQIVDREQRRAA
jgi:hypothetical protein